MNPAERVRADLAAARSRGASFAAAWQAATDHALDRLEGVEARLWRNALEETRTSWELAYADAAPDRATLAAALLAISAQEHREPDIWAGEVIA